MRCKDCIHCNICNKTESDIYLGNKEGAVELYCVEFADESQYIKLPCKVGDTVYILAGPFGNKYEQDVCEGFYSDNGVPQVRTRNTKGNHGTYGVMGETVFLTREEAEKALKEREEK